MNRPQRIVIVGASSGLGLLCAEEFARRGWTVGTAARNESALKQLKSRFPDKIEWQKIDINSEDSVKNLHELIKKIGGMDIYFHVSGICIENPDLDAESELRTVDTNVVGFTRMIDAVFNYFKASNRKGRIAAITSVAGTKGIADLASYSASKRYQWNYLQALEQLARRENLPIGFNDIRPGWTRTPLISSDRRYLMAMNAEKVAAKAVKAIINNRRRTVIDWKWAVMATLWRLLPQSIWSRIPLHASYSARP